VTAGAWLTAAVGACLRERWLWTVTVCNTAALKTQEVRAVGSTADALQRIVRRSGVDDLVAVLADRLSGSDLTTLLLEVMRRRAAATTAPDLLRRYGHDRFTVTSGIDGRRLHELVATVLAALPDDVDVVELSPVAPLGTHSVVATVHQHKVVSTIRGTEVAADPTNALALEAAARRRALLREDPRCADVVRLAAVQRVLRAQPFDFPGALAHFTLFGLVTAGRDRGDLRFESRVLVDDVVALTRAILVAGALLVQVRVTDLSGGRVAAVDVLSDALAAQRRVTVVADPDRVSGRGYYTGMCFKIYAGGGPDQMREVGDGGFVEWTQHLLGNRRERLLISGIGLDLLAAQT